MRLWIMLNTLTLKENNVKIACLGWGSLIWKPGDLQLTGSWYADGPKLPIEFCRIGDGGELATALCMNAVPVPVMWGMLSTQNLPEACEALRKREAIPDERVDGIGILTNPSLSPGSVSQWAHEKGLDAVIWTGLPPRYQHQEGLIPTVEQAERHLSGLTGQEAEHAFNYIKQVPAQINTLYRPKLEQLIGELTDRVTLS